MLVVVFLEQLSWHGVPALAVISDIGLYQQLLREVGINPQVQALFFFAHHLWAAQ